MRTADGRGRFRVARVASAHFTQAGQAREIGVGFLCRERHQGERQANYLDDLAETGRLVPIK